MFAGEEVHNVKLNRQQRASSSSLLGSVVATDYFLSKSSRRIYHRPVIQPALFHAALFISEAGSFLLSLNLSSTQVHRTISDQDPHDTF